MPAPTTPKATTTPTPEAFEEFAARARAFNEDLVESGKKAGEAYLTTLERGLKSYADLHEEIGKALPFEWTAPVASAQATFVRNVTDAYVAAGRKLTAA